MVNVRFAPSPTGFLHLGSARTALFNWIYARKEKGNMFLRIEDTDMVRSKKEFLEEILRDLDWMGLNWDNDPVYQSRRFELYRQKANELLKSEMAYKEGEAIIFRVEKGKSIEINDLIHGKIVFNTDDIKDQVMIKSDGSPAYNFACVVDDSDMDITHIIRGDDHISNTPKQILFYNALGAALPAFAHMPLMMGADGSKLSKRHGAVAVEEYRREGYLPAALVNYLLLLGWSPGEDKEIITLDEAADIFDISRMKDVQARFDVQKLRWINGEHIMRKDVKSLMTHIRDKIEQEGYSGVDETMLEKLVELYKVRMKTFDEFIELTDAFFSDKYTVDEKGKRKYLEPQECQKALELFANEIEAANTFNAHELEEICRCTAEKNGLKAGQLIHPARMAISGKTKGAGLFEMMELMGREKVIQRMRDPYKG